MPGLQQQISENSARIDTLAKEKLAAERELHNWSSSEWLGNQPRDIRLAAPVERSRLTVRLTEIVGAIKSAQGERSRLNEAHLAASKTTPAPDPTADTKRAAATVETLEARRETLVSVIDDLERERAKFVLPAQVGDKRAEKEAARLSGELVGSIAALRDCEMALQMARDVLRNAEAEAAEHDADDRAAKAAVLSARAVEIAAKVDKHAEAMADGLKQCADLHRQIIKLRQISDTSSKRLASARPIEQALIRAGLKQFIPSIGAAISVPPRALADSYRALFPYAGRDTGEAA